MRLIVIVRSPIGYDQYIVKYSHSFVYKSIILSVLFVFPLKLGNDMFVIDNVKLRTRGKAL